MRRHWRKARLYSEEQHKRRVEYAGFYSRRVERSTSRLAVSPAVFPRPDYWDENAIVAGFQERNKTAKWSPEPKLRDFIDKHNKIMFITFGSMLNSDPVGKTELFLQVLRECEIPAIINISGGGFAEPIDYDSESVIFINSVPYDWIFPKMHAVVHHGGAGTTHSALKAGCATMAIPHAADQPMWDEFIQGLGVGPKGIPVAKIRKDNLKSKLLDLFDNRSYKACAERIAEEMNKEDDSEELYRFIVG